jgi:hypothetical protein
MIFPMLLNALNMAGCLRLVKRLLAAATFASGKMAALK